MEHNNNLQTHSYPCRHKDSNLEFSQGFKSSFQLFTCLQFSQSSIGTKTAAKNPASNLNLIMNVIFVK